MDSKPELTAEQLERIAKLTEMGGEVLFEASAGYSFHARGAMRLLAHILGQLYGETIRQTRGYDGLKDEVQTTFMSGMAISPNFGREEEDKRRAAYLERGCPSSQLQEEKAEAEKTMAVSIAKVKRNAAMNKMANACWKCHGTKDMGFTTHVPCDAC